MSHSVFGDISTLLRDHFVILKKVVRSICKVFMEYFNYIASFPRFSIVIIVFCRTDGLDWSLRYSEVCIVCLFLPERDDD